MADANPVRQGRQAHPGTADADARRSDAHAGCRPEQHPEELYRSASARSAASPCAAQRVRGEREAAVRPRCLRRAPQPPAAAFWAEAGSPDLRLTGTHLEAESKQPPNWQRWSRTVLGREPLRRLRDVPAPVRQDARSASAKAQPSPAALQSPDPPAACRQSPGPAEQPRSAPAAAAAARCDAEPELQKSPPWRAAQRHIPPAWQRVRSQPAAEPLLPLDAAACCAPAPQPACVRGSPSTRRPASIHGRD
jgi:hypothetical protein